MALKPVDTAIKILIGPLIDDSDYKTREEAIAYNQAGMEIDAILEKTDGTVAVTAITPTSGGLHDWAHTDQGYYELEIPASGGDFNNTEEGVLTVVGYCTGVLPFRSVCSYDIGTIQADVTAVKAKTDTIPTNPATQAKQDIIDTVVDSVLKLLRADKVIDISGSPWVTDYKTEGTEDILMSKTMKNTSGEAITNTNNVLGQLEQE